MGSIVTPTFPRHANRAPRGSIHPQEDRRRSAEIIDFRSRLDRSTDFWRAMLIWHPLFWPLAFFHGGKLPSAQTHRNVCGGPDLGPGAA